MPATANMKLFVCKSTKSYIKNTKDAGRDQGRKSKLDSK